MGKPTFLIHPIGGNVFCYQELARSLEVQCPIYALQAQGLDGQQAAYLSIEEMASHYLRLIRDIQPEGPYRLGGWSFGGIVAFEIAQQLRTQKQDIALLGLIDSTAPPKDPFSELEPIALLEAFAVDLGLRATDLNYGIPASMQEDSTSDEHLSWILAVAKQAQIVPLDVELTYVRHLWHVYQTNRQALMYYRPQPYDGSVLLFRAINSVTEVEQHLDDVGWKTWVEQEVFVHPIAGDHYSILQMPNVEAIAEVLKRALKDGDMFTKDRNIL